jgi:hypothetical protein
MMNVALMRIYGFISATFHLCPLKVDALANICSMILVISKGFISVGRVFLG